MNILITGGAGFIGMHLTKALLKKGHKVIILDCLLNQVHGLIPQWKEMKNVEFIRGDVVSYFDWNEAFEFKPEVIFHLAAETGTSQSMTCIHRHISTNVDGTAQMLEAINRHGGVKKVILSSSRAVYGAGVCDETRCTGPTSVYGQSKLWQEELLKLTCKVPYTILRFQNVYGPGQSILNPYTGIMSIFYKKLKLGETLEVYDNNQATRDFVYISDVVEALQLAMKTDEIGPFNIGTGKRTTILEVAETLKKEIQSNSDIKVTDYHRDGDVLVVDSHTQRAKDRLGFKAKVDIQKGIAKFIKQS